MPSNHHFTERQSYEYSRTKEIDKHNYSNAKKKYGSYTQLQHNAPPLPKSKQEHPGTPSQGTQETAQREKGRSMQKHPARQTYIFGRKTIKSICTNVKLKHKMNKNHSNSLLILFFFDITNYIEKTACAPNTHFWPEYCPTKNALRR